ncbi:putative dolichyl-diphosphooligosaccharide--protein glycotransferase [Helianthus annuus]|nr:putative dolichyl-diphosphooligosaccharide--protein glycotransferase [Helianthus annuus]
MFIRRLRVNEDGIKDSWEEEGDPSLISRVVNVPLSKFIALIEAVPGLARLKNDDFYKVIDMYLKIDLASHIIRVVMTLKVQSDGASPASDVLLAFPPAKAKHLALIHAAEVAGNIYFYEIGVFRVN